MNYTPYHLASIDFIGAAIVCFIIPFALVCWGAWFCVSVEPPADTQEREPRGSHMDEPEDDAAFAILSQADMNVLGQVMSTPQCIAASEQFERSARRTTEAANAAGIPLRECRLVPLEEFNELAALADRSARYHGQEF
jgi:hypothetical protein